VQRPETIRGAGATDVQWIAPFQIVKLRIAGIWRSCRPQAERRSGMAGRRVIVYYAWSKPEEVNAPLEIINNRFPTLFESRRMLYPTFEELSDPGHFDQSVAGVIDHILKRSFAGFV
jgi:hypothetical protein